MQKHIFLLQKILFMFNSLFRKDARQNLQVDTSHVEIKKPPVLFEDSQRVISKIKENLDGEFIAYWNSASSNMATNDVAAIFEMIRNSGKQKKLYLFIKSGGGNGQVALRITHLLRQHFDEIIGLIPLDCASAATMLALGANTIKMGSIAYLSAVDTSITHDLSPADLDNDLVSVSQNELNRVLKLWSEKRESKDKNPYGQLYSYVHPLVIGAVDRASSLSTKLTTEILSYHMDSHEKASEISNKLNSDYPSHSYPITLREAQKIGLNAEPLEKDLNDALLELNKIYSEMAQKARTDYDDRTQHDNEILSVIETESVQIFYQKDKDWKYRVEDKKWIGLNDESSWRKVTEENGQVKIEKFHVR